MNLYSFFEDMPCFECYGIYCDCCPHYVGFKMFILSDMMLTDCNNPFI